MFFQSFYDCDLTYSNSSIHCNYLSLLKKQQGWGINLQTCNIVKSQNFNSKTKDAFSQISIEFDWDKNSFCLNEAWSSHCTTNEIQLFSLYFYEKIDLFTEMDEFEFTLMWQFWGTLFDFRKFSDSFKQIWRVIKDIVCHRNCLVKS